MTWESLMTARHSNGLAIPQQKSYLFEPRKGSSDKRTWILLFPRVTRLPWLGIVALSLSAITWRLRSMDWATSPQVTTIIGITASRKPTGEAIGASAKQMLLLFPPLWH